MCSIKSVRLLLGCCFCLFGIVACRTPLTEQSQTLAKTRLQLGLLYLAQGNPQLAGKNLQKAVSLAPRDIYNQLAMAMYEQQIGENHAAQRRFVDLLASHPDNSLIQGKYAQFLCGQQHYGSAQKLFSQAIHKAEQQVHYQQMVSWLLKSSFCFMQAGQQQQAKRQLQVAYRLEPHLPQRVQAEIARFIDQGKRASAQLLMEIYPQLFSAENVEWVWLQIRFAVLTGQKDRINYYGKLLAQRYPQSEQYQRYLAHEY